MDQALPLLSLAAGVLPEFGSDEIVRAAAAAGYRACGIWFDPDTWNDALTASVAQALDETGLIALDMEPVFVTPDGDHGNRLIDAAAELGARNILTVSRGVAPGPFAERFARLCERAAHAAMSVCVEFARVFTIADLPTALDVVERVQLPNAGILIDNLHLERAGHRAADIAAVPPALLPYAQLCDAPAAGDHISIADLYEEAVHGRANLGDGDLDVSAVFDALPPATPISLEIRSRALRERYPDPVDRARSTLDAAQHFFESAAQRPS